MQSPIIIGGFYRSGTSLLRRLIDSHNNIFCAPEIKFFRDFFSDYPDDPLSHVRLFNTLPSLGLTKDECFIPFGKAYVECIKKAMSKSGKIRWADKNPENILYLNEWKMLIPNGFIFVHVIRNPLDALASLKEIGFYKTVPLAFEDKVKLYKHYIDAGNTFKLKYPSEYLEIHYEDLVLNPDITLTNFFSALNESYDCTILNKFYLEDRKHGIEDPKVLKTREIHSKSIGRGQSELTKEEIHLVEKYLPQFFNI